MQKVTTKAVAKVAAVATGLAMATSLLSLAPMAHAASLTSAQVQSILSLLTSFGADSATIANVSSALTGQPTTTTTTTTTSSSCTFTRDLTVGVSGADVTCLQQALIAGGYSIPAGATGYFGSETQAAVAAWQMAVGVSPDAGYFGPISRAHWNLGGSSTTTTGTVTVGTGTGLKIALSPTSPNGTVLVQGQGIGDLGDFVFTNPTASPITVTGLTFNRIGVSNDSTLNNVYLYNGVTRITDSAGVSNSQFSYTSAAGLFTVPAGSTYTVSVRADIATGTAGQQIGASLVSATVLSGALDPSVSFPINSGYQTISAANLATVSFQSGDTESGSTWTGSTLPVGAQTISPQTGETLWQNTVSVSQNPVWFQSMTFTNLGSISPSDLQNLTLYVDGTQVGSTVQSFNADGRTITFNLSGNPLELNTGSHVIRLAGDIVGGSNLTLQFSVQYSSDSMFVDSELNQPVTPEVNNGNFSAVSASPITIQSVGSSGVSVTKDPASQTNNIAVGTTDQNFATFDMLASGEPTKVTDLYACATVIGSGTGAGEGLQNGKIEVNGVQVGSTKAIVECSGSNSTDFSLGSSLILPASQTQQVSVYADASTATTSVGSGNTIQITLKQGSSNAQGQSSLTSTNVPAADTTGNTVSVTSTTLTAAEATGYGNQSVPAGTSGFKIGSFVLQSGSTGSINVNTIGILIGGTDATSIQNLRLVNDATGAQLGTTQASPGAPTASSTSTFSVNLTLPSSSTQTIDVYADVPTGSTGNLHASVSASATSATTQNGQTASIGANNVELQTITVGNGTLNVSIGAGNPVSQNVIAGSSNLQVADYSFSANGSAYTVKNLEFTMPAASSSAVSSLSIQYKDVNGNTQTATGAFISNGTTATTSFSGLTMYVPSNSSADLTVWVSTPTITTGATTISGTQIAVTLIGTDGTNVQVQDSAGNITDSINGGANINSNANAGYGSLVLRQSVPTFAGQSLSSNVAPNSSTVLYQFTVSAGSNPVDFDQFSFSVGTSSLTASGFSIYDANNPSIALNTSPVNANSGGTVTIPLAQVNQIPANGSKTYILKASAPAAGWATGSSLSVNLAPADSTLIANNQTSAITANYIWSDRAANSDSITATEWTNGYLLRDLTDGTYSFTHS